MVGISLKSLGFLLHAFLDFQDGRRLRLILQTMNKPEWLKQIEMDPSPFSYVHRKVLRIFFFLNLPQRFFYVVEMSTIIQRQAREN
jgi:hypothetical protein